MANSPFTQVPTAFSDAPVDPTNTSFYPEGAVSLQGPPGPQGPEGPQGPIGPTSPGVPGRDGKDGMNGLDGRDGTDGAPGADGRDGLDGSDGQDGRGVQAGYVNASGDLIMSYTDGTVQNVGHVVGPQGPEGPAGSGGGGGGGGGAAAASIFGTTVDPTSPGPGYVTVQLPQSNEAPIPFAFDRQKSGTGLSFTDASTVSLPVGVHEFDLYIDCFVQDPNGNPTTNTKLYVQVVVGGTSYYFAAPLSGAYPGGIEPRSDGRVTLAASVSVRIFQATTAQVTAQLITPAPSVPAGRLLVNAKTSLKVTQSFPAAAAGGGGGGSAAPSFVGNFASTVTGAVEFSVPQGGVYLSPTYDVVNTGGAIVQEADGTFTVTQSGTYRIDLSWNSQNLESPQSVGLYLYLDGPQPAVEFGEVPYPVSYPGHPTDSQGGATFYASRIIHCFAGDRFGARLLIFATSGALVGGRVRWYRRGAGMAITQISKDPS